MAKKVSIENFASEVMKILDEYCDDVSLGVSEATEHVAKLGAKAINQGAAGKFKGAKYRRSWTYRVEGRRYKTSAVVYSRVPGLPHLLEKSHPTGKNGRFEGRPHIEPIEQQIIEKYTNEVRRAILKG